MTPKLSYREGPRPNTTPTNPHRQLDQNAPAGLQERLWRKMRDLPQVTTGDSLVSVPGARALHLSKNHSDHCPACFMKDAEFAHLHPLDDGSLHLTLPSEWRAEAQARGWTEPHPLAAHGIVPESIVMLYGPRNETEFEIVWHLVQVSHAYALSGVTDEEVSASSGEALVNDP